VNVVSDGRLTASRFAQFACLVVLVLAMTGLQRAESRRSALIMAAQTSDSGVANVVVTPGDVTIERGSSVVILARFSGKVPAEATLVAGSNPEAGRRINLTRSLADPVFGGTLTDVASNLVYRVEFAEQKTRDFKVSVFDYPALVRSDVKVTFPTYTGLSEKKLENTRRVSAVEGSTLEWARKPSRNY